MDNQTIDNNQQTQDVISTLPPEMQALPSMQKFKGKSAQDLASSYMNLESAFNKKMDGFVKVPGQDAKPEDIQEFYRQIGVPDKPDSYELPDFKKKYGEDFKSDANLSKWFQEKAHENGLSKNQFAKLYEDFIDMQKGQVSKLQEMTKQMYGDKFDDAVKKANSVLPHLPEALQGEAKVYIGFDPFVTKVFAELADKFTESRMPNNPGFGNDSSVVDNLLKRKNEILKNPDYRDRMKNSQLAKEMHEITLELVRLGKSS